MDGIHNLIMIRKTIALLLFIILLPLYIFISLLIYFIDGKPILFTQEKLGKNHKSFKMYKFRTMAVDTIDIPSEKMINPSITKTGYFLRQSSLDEIPQLFNIINGEMRFIGPRPCMANNEEIIKNLRKNSGVHKLYPGITGWAQVNGRDLNSFQKKVELDLYYMENKSFYLDLKILFLTFFVILFKQKDIKH